MKVTWGITKTRAFHVSIAALIKLTTSLETSPVDAKRSFVYLEGVRALVSMIAPFAPCHASEMWEIICPNPHANVFEHGWPVFEEKYIVQKDYDCIVMVSGFFLHPI